MNDRLAELTRENAQLGHLAETDWLTSVLNRGGTQKHIQQRLDETSMGVVIVLDVDYFKQVNDRYGHLTGDNLLREIARILKTMVLSRDILGRVGGDEFIVYLQTNQDERFAEERCRQIQKRLQTVFLEENRFKISVTCGYAVYQERDDYQSIFDRADQKLIRKKNNRNNGVPQGHGSFNVEMEIDVSHIQMQLAEQAVIPGGFCQDYETFKNIYRFVKRRIDRTKGIACIILFTLTDGDGNFPPLCERERQMTLLATHIQMSLRAGDVFTQYSGAQFLVLVPDVSKELAKPIAQRIHNTFYQEGNFNNAELLLHHSFPM